MSHAVTPPSLYALALPLHTRLSTSLLNQLDSLHLLLAARAPAPATTPQFVSSLLKLLSHPSPPWTILRLLLEASLGKSERLKPRRVDEHDAAFWQSVRIGLSRVWGAMGDDTQARDLTSLIGWIVKLDVAVGEFLQLAKASPSCAPVLGPKSPASTLIPPKQKSVKKAPAAIESSSDSSSSSDESDSDEDDNVHSVAPSGVSKPNAEMTAGQSSSSESSSSDSSDDSSDDDDKDEQIPSASAPVSAGDTPSSPDDSSYDSESSDEATVTVSRRRKRPHQVVVSSDGSGDERNRQAIEKAERKAERDDQEFSVKPASAKKNVGTSAGAREPGKRGPGRPRKAPKVE